MSEIKFKVRAAVYTRKSHDEGLEQEFNSLNAQREAGEAFIASQRHEGWVLVPDYYDDGGFSGGNMERPALKRLLQDIEAEKIDIVVVYKIDRLTRSLIDFSKLIEIFEKHKVSFVSVTQQFNTTTSIGRLMLNVLLSFAQFEREVAGERTRDKIAASKRKGMWMGGIPSIGYDIENKKLVVNEAEAEIVKYIFKRFTVLKSVTTLIKELREKGYKTKTWQTKDGILREGRLMDKGSVYQLLENRVYIGEIVHKDKCYTGIHKAIIERSLWDKVQEIKAINPHIRKIENRHLPHALLKGVIRCIGCNSGMTQTYTRRKGKQYRYYSPNAVIKKACTTCPVGHTPVGEIETVVFRQLKSLFKAPEMIVAVWGQVGKHDNQVKEADIFKAFADIENIWEELFPYEQERIIKLLVKRVLVHHSSVDIEICASGIDSIVSHVRSSENKIEAKTTIQLTN